MTTGPAQANASASGDAGKQPWDRNPRLFIWFRIFFNCRYYYPVYALMFLDFGLSEEQFAYLNVAWALAIVVLEVPSGALADHFGRRALVIAAAVLMVVEMVVLSVMPVVDSAALGGDPDAISRSVSILFAVFLLNRVISGAAEAAASGADEALAYDSLNAANRESMWSQLTVQLMKWQSVAFVFVTLAGAAVYDPDVVNQAAAWLGIDRRFTQAETLKFPIYLTLVMALATLVTALRFYEPPSPEGEGASPKQSSVLPAIREGFRRIFAAGRWILKSPAALLLLLVGLSFDSVIRLYYTVGSLWLETIGYEPRYFGMISVAGSLSGIAAASIGAKLMATRLPGFNFRLLTALVLIGLVSLAFPIRYWSVVFLPTLWLAMRFLHFFLSNYLNRVTPSENRATVLSFRGLTMNLSYGFAVWVYGLQTVWLRGQDAAGGEGKNAVFAEAVSWWWMVFAIVALALVLYRHFGIGKSWNELIPPAA
jgi:MFS family permease